MIVKIQSGVWE